MNNRSSFVDSKASKQPGDINKITNVLNPANSGPLSPPSQRTTKISSTPGVPSKNTNVVNQLHLGNTSDLSQVAKQSNYKPDSNQDGKETNVDHAEISKELEDDDFGIRNLENSNEDERLIEELRQMGKKRMMEMLQNKQRLEAKLQQMTQKNANKNAK